MTTTQADLRYRLTHTEPTTELARRLAEARRTS